MKNNTTNNLNDLIKWVRDHKGITKLTIEELMEYQTEFTLWKQRN